MFHIDLTSPRRTGLVLILLLAAALMPVERVRAETVDAEDDHETARMALENKEVLPLGQVLALVQEQFGGNVIEIGLAREDGIWIYDIELIDATGRVRDLDVDAATGAIISGGTAE